MKPAGPPTSERYAPGRTREGLAVLGGWKSQLPVPPGDTLRHTGTARTPPRVCTAFLKRPHRLPVGAVLGSVSARASSLCSRLLCTGYLMSFRDLIPGI